MRPSSDDARRPSVGRLSLSVKIQQWRTAHPPVAGVTLGCSGCSVSRVAVQCGAGAGSRGVKAMPSGGFSTIIAIIIIARMIQSRHRSLPTVHASLAVLASARIHFTQPKALDGH